MYFCCWKGEEYIVCHNSKLIRYDLKGNVVSEVNTPKYLEYTKFHSLAYSPDEKHVAYKLSTDDYKHGILMEKMFHACDTIYFFIWISNEELLVHTSNHNVIISVDGKITSYKFHYTIENIHVFPDKTFLISTFGNKIIKNNEVIFRVDGNFPAIAFSPCGKFVASFDRYIVNVYYNTRLVLTYEFLNKSRESRWSRDAIYWLSNERLLIKIFARKTIIYILNLKTKKITHTFRHNKFVGIEPIKGRNDLFLLRLNGKYCVSDLMTEKQRFRILVCLGLLFGGCWHNFLVLGVYDPRLLVHIWAYIQMR